MSARTGRGLFKGLSHGELLFHVAAWIEDFRDLNRPLSKSSLRCGCCTIFWSFGKSRDPRIFDPQLAEGPLLDLGTYLVSLLIEIFGVPEGVVGLGQPDPSCVDGQLSAILTDADGN